eukprot:TRINITY_DN74793_c0_g1_i1.p1 TRINITY_DN74793_c0_g1~~TRINITY_DN74793_c0_g1_i1.p1  ORF type:complete len:296 (+),score=80.72 TRINITY_DN74793_c0_g1_i1:49-936(+)
MGAAASLGAGCALRAVTDEELKDTLQGLSDAEKTRLFQALAASVSKSGVSMAEDDARTAAQTIENAFGRGVSGCSSTVSSNPDRYRKWTAELCLELQEAVDRVFAKEHNLAKLGFSLTIADPILEGCPLIGCSRGFSTLCGYSMEEIIGRNCRFLVDPVPKDMIDQEMRDRSRQFCEDVRQGKSRKISSNTGKVEPWLPAAQEGEVFCCQMNMRKNGTLFKNMFYMVAVELDEQPYIIALQTELQQDQEHMDACAKACECLSSNMDQVVALLSKKFWYMGPLRRQDKQAETLCDD